MVGTKRLIWGVLFQFSPSRLCTRLRADLGLDPIQQKVRKLIIRVTMGVGRRIWQVGVSAPCLELIREGNFESHTTKSLPHLEEQGNIPGE